MSSNKKKVLLCTGSSGGTDDKENSYKKCLLEIGLDCQVLQVLDFEFINLDDLSKHLLDSESYEGLILTSPRAAIALSLVKSKNQLCIEPWINKSIFCIGPATESIAKEQVGLVNILGTDCGNAKNLANFIVKVMKKDCKKCFLLPCSDIARDTISNMLSDEGRDVKKIVVYKTKTKDGLEEATKKALEQSPHALVYFSPSVVEKMINALHDDKQVFQKCKNIAIGPVTKEALLNAGISVDGVSEKPEAEALIKTIQTII